MAKLNRTVSVYGTEQEFIEAVYDAFLEVDGVTMNPTKANISTIFADSSAKATFTMTYHGVSFTFVRQYTNSSLSNSYIISVNNTTLSNAVVNFVSYATARETIATRTWKMDLYANSKAIKLALTDYSNTTTLHYLFITYQLNESDVILYKPDTSAITTVASLTLNPMVSGMPSCKTVRALTYTSPNSGVDTFDFTILKNTSGEKVAVIEGLKSCSTVPADSILTIDSQEHYSIGTDVIIEI